MEGVATGQRLAGLPLQGTLVLFLFACRGKGVCGCGSGLQVEGQFHEALRQALLQLRTLLLFSFLLLGCLRRSLLITA